LFSALLLAAHPALAQPIDMTSGGPVDVTAVGGFEWRENEQRVIASGDARAVRDNVTVLADQLSARYRKKAGAPAPAAGAAPPAGVDTGNSEVYRLEADGHVRIVTPTDEADGDHAIYDIDQAVLLMTGRNLRLTTPQDVVTARDSVEYWSEKHMAVARGNAVVVTTDGRRVAADTLVAYTTAPDNAAKPQPAAVTPATAPSNAPLADPLAASGKLQRVEAFGNVEVRTATDIVRGDRAVYVPDSGIARVVGHVRITHGQNQLNGPAADVNMKTGIAHLISDPGQRVQGLIVPNDAGQAPAPQPAKPKATTP